MECFAHYLPSLSALQSEDGGFSRRRGGGNASNCRASAQDVAMKFFAVFSLQLLHAYYRDGRCLDFAIEPTLETQRLLTNHRCVLKTTPNGVQVLIGGDAQ